MNLEILDRKRKKLLSQLTFLKKYGFYMAGGTALALQISHRTSLDFDFYTEKKFNSEKLRQEFSKRFKEVIERQKAEDTLILLVDGLVVSFFRYVYPLINPLIKIDGVNLASAEDIAAMKILAISQRGRKRDFIDIYFLIQKFSLSQIIEFTKRKYPMFNIYVGLQGLTYFKDADEDLEKTRYRLLKKVRWSELKKFITLKVNTFRKSYL